MTFAASRFFVVRTDTAHTNRKLWAAVPEYTFQNWVLPDIAEWAVEVVYQLHPQMVALWVFDLVGSDAGLANVESALLSFTEVHALLRRLAARVAFKFSALIWKLTMVFARTAEDDWPDVYHKLGALYMEHLLTLFTLNKLSVCSVTVAALALIIVQLLDIFLTNFVKQVTCRAFQ